MIINLFLLIYRTFSNSLIQLNWFYFELFLLIECNTSIFLFTLCEFAIWIILIVSNISSFSVVALHPIQVVVPTIIIECGWNIEEWMNESKSLVNKHYLHLSIIFFAQSKAFRIANLPFSCSELWPYFSHWSNGHITYFTPFHPISFFACIYCTQSSYQLPPKNNGIQKRKNAGCEDRTHDLGIMRPTLFQLSQTRCDLLSKQPYITPFPPHSSHVFMNEKIKIRYNHLFNYISGEKRDRYKQYSFGFFLKL